MLQQRDAQRMKRAQRSADIFPIPPGRILGQLIQQAVQLHAIDTQARGQAAEHAGTIIFGQMFG